MLFRSILRELRAIQVHVHLDDFGTGYSSLGYLSRFPVSRLKIDRSFIARIGTGGDRSGIVGAIVTLAHNLDMRVIAEGVESAGQLEVLRELGCEYAQGFYFSRPLDSHEAGALLREARSW